jgi:hypothetical protein
MIVKIEKHAPDVQVEVEAAKNKSRTVDSRTVILGADEHRVADEFIEKLATLRGVKAIYNRGGVLVEIVPVDNPDLPVGLLKIKPVAVPTLRERITLAADVVRVVSSDGGSELKSSSPPRPIVEAVAARGYYRGIRQLTGIVQSPTIRPDGSIFQTSPSILPENKQTKPRTDCCPW